MTPRLSRFAVGLVLTLAVGAGIALAARPDLRMAFGLMPTVPYANPVFNRDSPDPALLPAPVDGWWYAYATQSLTADGADINIQVIRSRDLVAWEEPGDALPVKPPWASSTQDFWAPHVVARDATYVMYYSAARPSSTSTQWLFGTLRMAGGGCSGDPGLSPSVFVSSPPTG